MLTDRQTD